MLMISLACHGAGAVAAVETEVAPTSDCHDLAISGFHAVRECTYRNEPIEARCAYS
jgi:hypothetical protein